jgi:hypothetical protein
VITTCTDCGSLYQAGSEEQAREPQRWCFGCTRKRGIQQPPETLAELYPAGWPTCPGCGCPALDGHITCGDVTCDEGGRR